MLNSIFNLLGKEVGLHLQNGEWVEGTVVSICQDMLAVRNCNGKRWVRVSEVIV